MVSPTFFCQKAAGGAERLGLRMERAHLTTLQGPPGVRVGDHLPGALIHSRSCGSPAGVLPTHPPLWDSQRDLLSETPPLLPNLPLGPPHLCTMGLTRPAPWLSLLPHQQALQQQKLHLEFGRRPLVPCALGSRGLRKGKGVDCGGSAPPQGETQPRAASTQAWCEQTAPSAPMQQAQQPAESSWSVASFTESKVDTQLHSRV